MTIGITGVTGKLGSYTARVIADADIPSIHLARTPARAEPYERAEIRQASYENTPATVAALTGVDVLLMVSARENPRRAEEHGAFVDAAKAAGVRHIVDTSFYGASEQATFTLSHDHARTERHIREAGLAYTFLRDNFYLDFFVDMCVNDGEIRGPAGAGRVSAVARRDSAAVAAAILMDPQVWEDRVLNLTGPEDLTMGEIARAVSQSTGTEASFHDETIEEAYASRLRWPAEQWQYDAWVSTYTAIRAGEQEGVSTDVERVLGRPATSLRDLLEEC